MPVDTIIVLFFLFFAATYLILDQSFVNVICGFVILSNGANLFLLSLSGNPDGKSAPILDESSSYALVDPLPQAMILTAIVIGLGMLAFLAALIYKVYVTEQTDQFDIYEGNSYD